VLPYPQFGYLYLINCRYHINYDTYLRNFDINFWVIFAFSNSGYASFGHVTSNLAESSNSWLGNELRSINSVSMLANHAMHLACNIEQRWLNYEKWFDNYLGLVPKIFRKFQDIDMKVNLLFVSESTPYKKYDVYFKDNFTFKFFMRTI